MTVETTPKFCKDCDHFHQRSCEYGGYSECYADFKEDIDLVSGKSIHKGGDCYIVRENVCGKEAKYFKPKRTIWMKLKGLLDE